jgi:ABC-type proline/glycine betaine transport system substrate-binding protein
MTRVRLVVASALLVLTAVAAPAAASALESGRTVQGQDIGWGAAATSTTDEATTEPTATETSTSADSTLGDIGWG